MCQIDSVKVRISRLDPRAWPGRSERGLHVPAPMPAIPGKDLGRSLTRGALSGLLLGIASLPGPFGLLVFVALVPLLAEIDRGVAPRRAGAAGFVAGLLYFAIGFGFVPFARVGGGLALPAAYLLGIVVLAAPVAAFAALLAWLRRFSRSLPLLLAPGGWIALELVRSQDLIGVPWLHLAYALADLPWLIQAASLVGLYGISCWVASVNSGLVAGAALSPRGRVLLAISLSLPLLPGLVGPAPEPHDGTPSLRVAAVQPGIPESSRHDRASFHPNLRRLLELSTRVVERPVDLIVWPESAYERDLAPNGDAFLVSIANGLGAPLLTGAWRFPRPLSTAKRNAALLVSRQGELIHAADKVHPVTIYERAPRTAISRTLARLGLWTGRFEAGEAASPVAIERTGGSPVPVGVLICIDTSYPDLVRELRARGARLLIELSNEAGTGRWSARLHARIARFRAVEMRTPFVRVANTGPTQWIDARGRLVHELAPGAPDAAVRALELAGPPPLAARLTARVVVAAALGFGIGVSGLSAGFRRRAHRRAARGSGPRFDLNQVMEGNSRWSYERMS